MTEKPQPLEHRG